MEYYYYLIKNVLNDAQKHQKEHSLVFNIRITSAVY